MTFALLPYAKDALCEKCGFGPCLTEFHDAMDSLGSTDGQYARCVAATGGDLTAPGLMRWIEWPAHLHRTCPNCRWDWAEAPRVAGAGTETVL